MSDVGLGAVLSYLNMDSMKQSYDIDSAKQIQKSKVILFWFEEMWKIMRKQLESYIKDWFREDHGRLWNETGTFCGCEQMIGLNTDVLKRKLCIYFESIWANILSQNSQI